MKLLDVNVPVIAYELTSGFDDAQPDPSSWALEGSNDGSTYVLLDKRTSQQFATGNESQRFEIAAGQVKVFSRYRLSVSTGLATRGVQLSKFQLFTPEQVGIAGQLAAPQSAPGSCIPASKLVVTSRGEAVGTAACNVVDGQVATKWKDVAERSWLQFELVGGRHPVELYELQSACDHPEMDPQEWVFEGSDDGSTWTELDRQAAQLFTARCGVKRYPIAEAKQCPYRMYRLYIFRSRHTDVQLAGVKLYTAGSIRATWAATGSNVPSVVSSTPPVLTRSVPAALAYAGTLIPQSNIRVTARGEYAQAREVAANLIDGSVTTKWLDWSPQSWVVLALVNVSQPVVRYELVSANDYPERDPADWQFEGSLDNSNWVVLDNRSNEFFPSRFLTKSYNITPADGKAQAFRFYRLNIRRAYRFIDCMQLSCIKLYASS